MSKIAGGGTIRAISSGLPLRALIIDDEPVARKVLREELEALPDFDIEVAGEASDGTSGLTAIEQQKPDLVFLDVQMPGLSGFDLLASLPPEKTPAVVMVTAYDAYALRAFELGAVDYLLKPIGQERLTKCLERVRRTIGDQKEKAADLQRLQAAGRSLEAVSNAQSRFPKIVGKSGDSFYVLNLQEILAFQADGDLTWILTAKGRYQATQNLRALEARLEGSLFRRIHRNALINLEHVRKLDMLSSQRWLITLVNGQEFTVSKRQARSVREWLHW